MENKEMIITTALNYIEGWYNADPERMDRALDPRLAKRKIVSESEMLSVDKEWMLKATKEGKGKINNSGNARRIVTVLDISPTMASVRIDSEKYIDYLHLSKIHNEWKIINVLWDFIK